MSKPEIQKRRERVQQEALKSVAKTEQLNIRMDESSIERLYELAAAERKPVGTMVREWIIERLDSQGKGDSGVDERLRTIEQKVDLLVSEKLHSIRSAKAESSHEGEI